MNKVVKIMSAFCMVAIIGLTSVLYAATTSTFDYSYNEKYKIVFDGETVTVPDSTQFADGYNLSLTNYQSTLSSLAEKSNNISYSNKSLAFSGVFITKFNDEYKAIVDLIGVKKSTVDEELLNKIDLVKYFLPQRKTKIANYQTEYNDPATAADRKLILNTLISNYQQDVVAYEALKAELQQAEASQSILLGIPHLVRKVTTTTSANATANTVEEKSTINYYLYSTIYRDLRLNSIMYAVNLSNAVPVENFDKDTYTYNVTLPAGTPKNATIKTTSKSSMVSTVGASSYASADLGITVKDTQIQLVDGKGTAKIQVEFNIAPFANNDDYTQNVIREYTVNFSTPAFKKGDLDRNGLVDSADAAIALNLYKYNNATAEDLQIGDMDENGMIDSADAAIILNVYKYNL